jgi:hypothetical protein
MFKKNLNLIKIFILFFIICSYFFGFFLRENIAGGAELDFLSYTWPVIIALKENFSYTISNYASYGEGSPPMFHIINAYFNPFTYSQLHFQATITLISILNIFFFSQILEMKYKLKKIDTLLFSSIFLILPFFRSSAFWGLTENFGWLFLILSIKYFIIYQDKNINKNYFNVLLICSFSSLALYTRPYLVFFPIFIILRSFFFKDYFLLKLSSFIYFILSIPGLILLFLWSEIPNAGIAYKNLLADYHNPKFILKNLVIFSSIFFFYLIPFVLSQFSLNSKISKKNFIVFFIFSIFFLFLNFFSYFDYLKIMELGGGVVLKISKFVFGNIFFFIALSALGLTFILSFLSFSKNNFILFFCLLIFCFPKYIFQEYFEPLVLILFFSLIDLTKEYKKTFNKNITHIVVIFFYISYFLGSFYYRYYF